MCVLLKEADENMFLLIKLFVNMDGFVLSISRCANVRGAFHVTD